MNPARSLRKTILAVMGLSALALFATVSARAQERLELGVFLRSTGHEDPAKALEAVRTLGLTLIQVGRLPIASSRPRGRRNSPG